METNPNLNPESHDAVILDSQNAVLAPIGQAPAELIIPELRAAIKSGDAAALTAIRSGLHPADIADSLEYLSRDERLSLFLTQPSYIHSDILTELEESVRQELLPQLPPQRVARALIELDSDDQIDMIEDLEDEEKEQILAAIPLAERRRLIKSLTFPEYSVGRLMAREFVALPQSWSVGQAIDYMRASANLPDDFYDLYLTDSAFQPTGKLPLARLLRERRDRKLCDICEVVFQTYEPDEDQEELAYQFRKYSLMTAPVVDGETGRLIGIVTADDVIDVIDEEAEDDMLKLAGLSGDSDVFASSLNTARTRFAWLLVNLGTAVLASGVIALFEASIQSLVALAVLMPIVASMGGNAGTQTLTVVVRALATKDITNATQWRFLLKELTVGTINGLAFAVIAAGFTYAWKQDLGLSLVIATAMIANLLIAAFSGTLIPLALERLHIDPANASGVFLTTVTDVIGFLAFLGLASAFLL